MFGMVILTYILASVFAIAGMGAAGVLIPNYIAMGLGVHAAMLLGLTQNTAELTVATAMNWKKGLIEWRKVARVLVPAALFVPLGAYVNVHIPRVLVLVVFALFLLFALYRMLSSGMAEGDDGWKIYALGAVEGFTAGLIGMDAAPIALIAFSYLFRNPKKVSANTAATALGVSGVTLLTYVLLLPKIPIAIETLAAVGTAGFLGGITGSLLMHRIKPLYVRYTMLAILSLALVEIVMKIFEANVPETLHVLSVEAVVGGFLAFLYGMGRRMARRPSPAP
ncbi:sulfite exporter TauE/SafE family protein [Thermococcus gammatolerans]|uniref:Probable membrane transporter protein n=1 Tax=Thermococcus gammatolerans (strain DSM 15229 / JCM 11827 / EJ3) TaxID=593117 RepID=C5A530_THEGJ|nr:sulfite exporter TauE/SafE family protein [Thermococcus gammatolerans]ACS33342.1 Predicted permease [Thermococcus gammatolerans EJ3]